MMQKKNNQQWRKLLSLVLCIAQCMALMIPAVTAQAAAAETMDATSVSAATVGSIFGNNPGYTWTEIPAFTESWDGDAVTITPTKSIVTAATFNMAASTQYYAEATFEINSSADRPGFGLGHFKALNTSIDGYDEASMGRVCYLSMYSSNGYINLLDLDTNNTYWWQGRLDSKKALDDNTFTTITIAIARTTEKLYTFIDGELWLEMDADAAYKDAETTPGILCAATPNAFTAKKVVLLSGSEAGNKLATLLPDQASATIANKGALTAEWTAGEGDRSVELVYSPDGYNKDNSNTQIVSSNTSVVAVDGTTLKAVGAGTATITVKVNGIVTDSVEITVSANWTVTSPDGTITALMERETDGKLYYTVTKDGMEVVKRSEMGIDIEEDDFFAAQCCSVNTRRVQGEYENISGKRKNVTYDCNETVITLKGRSFYFDITMRCYDDGYAFRYGIRKIDGTSGTMTVREEKTQFALPENTIIWAQVYKSSSSAGEYFSYEEPYDRQDISTIDSAQQFAMPLLYRISGTNTYSMIAQSGLIGSGYYGSFLQVPEGKDGSGLFQTVHSPAGSAVNDNIIAYPFESPWRLGITGNLKTVEESELVEKLYDNAEYWKPDNYDSLSDAKKAIYNYDWVEPGACAWSWLNYQNGEQSDFNPGSINYQYLDLAIKMGWKWILLDGGWESNLDKEKFKAFSDYAAQNGVKIIVWCYSLQSFGNGDKEILEAVLDRYVDLGISGIKPDFFDGQYAGETNYRCEDVGMIAWYETIFQECAKRKMVVDCHGCNVPTGERRVYPNVINKEAVLGNEYVWVGARYTINQLLIRGVIGPTDFTPVVNPRSANQFSSAHQLALSFLFESGMPMYGDEIAAYTDEIADFYSSMPALRDETIFLDGAPDQFYAAAVRSGDQWLVGAVCYPETDVTIDFSFLGDGEYVAEMFTDSDTGLQKEIITVTKNDKITSHLVKNGGVIFRVNKSIFRNNPSYTWTETPGFTESWGGDAVTITPTKSIVTAATFNMDASTEYYAEVTFEIDSSADRPGFGLAHFKTLNTSIDGYDEASMGRVCYLSMYSSNGYINLLDLDTNNTYWWQGRLDSKKALDDNTFTTITIAIARTEAKLYTFINGKLWLEMDADAAYKDAATTPGILCAATPNAFTAENVVLLSGSEAENKLETLLEESIGKVERWNLVLQDDLAVKFYISVNSTLKATAKITVTVDDKPVSYNVAELTAEDDGTYCVQVNVAPAQMNDPITVQVVNGEGAGIAKTYTVTQYAQALLNDTEMSSYHSLVKEMLNYGGMAQTYFNHNAENPANGGLTGVGSADVPAEADTQYTVSGSAPNVSFYGASLVLRNKTAIRFYFTVNDSIENHSFCSGDTALKPVAKDDKYYVEVAGINPQDLDKMVTVTVDGTLSVTYSPMNYIVRKSATGDDNLKDLLKAMYNYHLAAKELVTAATT